jgi:hypothetical protein
MIRYWPHEERAAVRKAIEAGAWVAPVACGLEACGQYTSLVVLCPATNEIAVSHELPGQYCAEQVDSWLEEAAKQFMTPLCCAVDALTAPLALQHHMPAGDCFWVRYRGLRVEPPWKARRNPDSRTTDAFHTHPNQIKALALARQLHADFHDFETVHTDLQLLQESVKRLTCILHRSFVPDLQYVVTRCHDKVRF